MVLRLERQHQSLTTPFTIIIPLSLGDEPYPTPCFSKGQLSDFVVYDQALSTEAVMAYDQGAVETSDAVLLATMDEDDYSTGSRRCQRQ